MLKENLSATLKGENPAEERVEAVVRDLNVYGIECEPVYYCTVLARLLRSVTWKPEVLASLPKDMIRSSGFRPKPRRLFW